MLPSEIDSALDELASSFADVVLIERFAGTPEPELSARFSKLLPPPGTELHDAIRHAAYQKLIDYITSRWGQVQYIEHTYWN